MNNTDETKNTTPKRPAKKETADEQKFTISVGDGAAIPVAKDKGLVSAWRVSLVGALLVLGYLLTFKSDPYWKIFKFLPDGIMVTFQVTICSIALAIVIGLFTGLGRISKNYYINLVASTYVEVVRGIPLLVQLFYIYYALAKFVQVPAMVAAVLAMSFCYGAYMGEVFRLVSIPLIGARPRPRCLWDSTVARPCFTLSCPRPGAPSCLR